MRGPDMKVVAVINTMRMKRRGILALFACLSLTLSSM
jgi:hypothetical protein